jgi:hypothetical protein
MTGETHFRILATILAISRDTFKNEGVGALSNRNTKVYPKVSGLSR